MEIQNYYLLLELSLDPPEADPEVIDQAIQKKQIEWSRLRNHPTKATLAQQHISLIPDITKVMNDPELRQKEALEAHNILLSREKKKFIKIDRHIAILYSKGNITKKEKDLLAQLHSVPKSKINERILQKKQYFEISRQIERLIKTGKCTEKNIDKIAKSHKIDKQKLHNWANKKTNEKSLEIRRYIAKCSQRGYIIKEEISLLSYLYVEEIDDLTELIKFQIRKKRPQISDDPQTIDPSIEKLIKDQLKIIEESSLYDFLELPPDTDLVTIQQRALDKEAQARRIGKKDAVATASGTLAGHCLTIFKTEAARKAYDNSLIRSRIAELDADIEGAGIDGKIRPEYLDILLRTAIRLGMDIDEANTYIETYCQNKKWKLERKKVVSKKKIIKVLKITAAVLLIALIVGSIVTIKIMHANRLKNAYETALRDAEQQPELEGREVILKNFIKYHSSNEYTEKIQSKINDIRKRIKTRDYQKASDTADALASEGKFEGALNICSEFLKKYPKNNYSVKIRKKIEELSDGMDDRDFNALKRMKNKDYDSRIKAYNTYFEKYPDGRHIDELRKIIVGLIDRFYANLEKELRICESNMDWQKCISLCETFMDNFKDTTQAAAAEGLKNKFKNKQRSQADIEEMKKEAQSKGTDYESARQIYLEYLEAHPELPSYLKKLIVTEVKILDKKIEFQRQEIEAWELAYQFSQNERESLSGRIAKIDKFIKKYPGGLHIEDAKEVLKRLKDEKTIEDENILAQQMAKKWKNLVRYSKNSKISLTERMRKVENYIRQNQGGHYQNKAAQILDALQQQQRLEDERLRRQQANLLRRQQEQRRVKAAIRNSGGRFTDNGNNTFTDRKTGLTWCMFDASFDLNRCVNFQSGLQYVSRLKTGGHTDWRMPSANEMEMLLMIAPAFPANNSTWFWTSEVFWHGWNKNVQIFIPKSRSKWSKESASVSKCGSVLAVRP